MDIQYLIIFCSLKVPFTFIEFYPLQKWESLILKCLSCVVSNLTCSLLKYVDRSRFFKLCDYLRKLFFMLSLHYQFKSLENFFFLFDLLGKIFFVFLKMGREEGDIERDERLHLLGICSLAVRCLSLFSFGSWRFLGKKWVFNFPLRRAFC